MQQRQHFLTLDALRGVAALAVMIYHQQHAAWMAHGYLAVDFFFILSGFVIAKAYEDKLISKMSFGRFVLVRIARLYPLLIGATLLAAAYMGMTAVRGGGDLRFLAVLPTALLGLPDPSGTFAPDPFPLLPVVWSLFFELLANFLYAFRVQRLTTRKLIAIILCSAVLLVAAICIHGNGELGNTYQTLWAGVPRVVCSFFAGILFYRMHVAGRLVRPEISPLILAAALFAALGVGKNVSWVYDAGCVFFVFPLILMAGVNNEPAGRWKPFARFSADASYPLYLLHLPLFHWLSVVLPHFGMHDRFEQLFALVMVPLLAYAAHALFDRPLQDVLKSRLAIVRSPNEAAGEVRAL